MVTGLVLGGILKIWGKKEIQKASFTDNFFFDILLPPIILEAGYSLEKRKFFSNLGTILSLAVIGTGISTYVSGWIFAKSQSTLGDSECFVYAALVSRTMLSLRRLPLLLAHFPLLPPSLPHSFPSFSPFLLSLPSLPAAV